MDCKKIRSIILGLCALLLFTLVPRPTAALEGQWQSWTCLKNACRMSVINDSLYVATDGGLLIIGDPSGPGTALTNVDGLGTIELRDMLVDANGVVWIAADGRLLRLAGGQFSPYMFEDENQDPIDLHCLAEDGDQLWIGVDGGLVLFSKTADNGQIEDSYGRFGDLSDFPSVNDIHLSGDSIWIATDAGLAAADRSEPKQLKVRANWLTFGAGDLGTGMVSSLEPLDGDIYLATGDGLQRLQMSGIDTSLTVLAGTSGYHYDDLSLVGDTLFYFRPSYFGFVANGAAWPLSSSGLPAAPSAAVSYNGNRWMAVSGSGLYWADGLAIHEYAHTGLPNNVVTDLTTNTEGIVTASFYTEPSARLIEGSWVSLDYEIRSFTTYCISDPDGNPVMGNFGNGLWRLRDDSLYNYDETNSTLRGNDDPGGGESYVVVNGLAADDRYLYISAYRALNDYAVAIADLERIDDPVNGWDSLGLVDGLNTNKVFALAWHDGRLAIGSELSGLYVCDLGDDPFARPSNACQSFTPGNSYLRASRVDAVAFSPTGELWAGTNAGLSRYDEGIERFVDVDLPAGVEPSVIALEFDDRGNLWVGTSGGAARYDKTTRAFEIFTTDNSDLVSNDVRAIHYDESTGITYIATGQGISVVPSQVGAPVSDVEQVVAFPNPFVVESADDRLSFNYAGQAMVTIYTVAGEAVTRRDVNEPWNGDNDRGQAVASGVYLFVVEDARGNLGRGKFLLVRR